MRKLVIIAGLLLLPVAASAETPSEGVPLKVRRGFFTETDIGGFLTLGGNDGYSNFQVYLQLGVGYDITEHIEIGLHVGIGANAANCYSGENAKGDCALSNNFTVTNIDVSFAYLFRIAERLYIAPKLKAGWTLLDPPPVMRADGTLISNAPNIGVGIGIEYATNMDHFTIGLDWTVFNIVVGPNIISMQFIPRVKYTF